MQDADAMPTVHLQAVRPGQSSREAAEMVLASAPPDVDRRTLGAPARPIFRWVGKLQRLPPGWTRQIQKANLGSVGLIRNDEGAPCLQPVIVVEEWVDIPIPSSEEPG